MVDEIVQRKVCCWHFNAHPYCFFLFAEGKHYDLFPKSFGEVLSKYRVKELHLTLTQGFWRHDTWGYPLEDAPPGVELWVWFHERTEK